MTEQLSLSLSRPETTSDLGITAEAIAAGGLVNVTCVYSNGCPEPKYCSSKCAGEFRRHDDPQNSASAAEQFDGTRVTAEMPVVPMPAGFPPQEALA